MTGAREVIEPDTAAREVVVSSLVEAAVADLRARFERTARSLVDIALADGKELVSGAVFNGAPAAALVVRDSASGDVDTYEASGGAPSCVKVEFEGLGNGAE